MHTNNQTHLSDFDWLDAWCFYKWVSSIQIVPWIWMMSSRHQGWWHIRKTTQGQWGIHLDTQSMLIINHLNGAPPVHGFLLERTSAGTLGIAYDGQKKSHTHLPDPKRIISIIPQNKHIHVWKKTTTRTACFRKDGLRGVGQATVGVSVVPRRHQRQTFLACQIQGFAICLPSTALNKKVDYHGFR